MAQHAHRPPRPPLETSTSSGDSSCHITGAGMTNIDAPSADNRTMESPIAPRFMRRIVIRPGPRYCRFQRLITRQRRLKLLLCVAVSSDRGTVARNGRMQKPIPRIILMHTLHSGAAASTVLVRRARHPTSLFRTPQHIMDLKKVSMVFQFKYVNSLTQQAGDPSPGVLPFVGGRGPLHPVC